jgi:hypothetical protein
MPQKPAIVAMPAKAAISFARSLSVLTDWSHTGSDIEHTFLAGARGLNVT